MRLRSAFLILTLIAACEEDEEPPTDSTGMATTTAPASTSTSSTTMVPTGPGSSDTGPSGPGICKRECMLPAECCTGIDNCPGASYPNNATCGADGICVRPTCESDQQCEAETAGAVCRMVQGAMQCVVLCTGDDPCMALGATFTCGSPTDDGEQYCNTLCTTGAISCGASECDDASGICTCMGDNDCIPGFRCV